MSNNILYLGTLNNVQLDFGTGNLTDISGFTGDVRNAVITQSVTNGVTDQAPSADAIHDFVTGISGYLSENSNDTLYDLTVQAGGANSSVIRLEPEAGTNEAESVSDITLSGGQDILIDENTGLGLITITHSNTALGATSSFNLNDSVINGVGIDGRGHVTGFTTTGLDGRYYTETEIDSILYPVYNYSGNWDTAYDRSVTGVDFNTSNGNLTLQKQDGSTIVESLDGRYLTGYTETQTLDDVVALGSTTDKGITVRNISIADGSDGASEISATGGDLTLDSAGGTVIVDDNLIVNSNATIIGNLLVSGTTTTVESSVTKISDPILTLGSGTIAANDGKDRGIEFIYYDTEIRTGFFGYDNQEGRFAFFTGATNTNENFSGVAAPLDLSATVDDSTIKYDNNESYLYIPISGVTNDELYYSNLTVNAGSGLANGGSVSLGGSTTLDVGAGNGITVGADSVSVTGYNGITVDGNGVSVTAYNGITVDASGVSVTAHNGIAVDGNGVSTVSDQTHLNKVEIGADQTNVGSGTNTTYGGVKVVRARSTDGTAVDLTEDGSSGDSISVAADSTLTFEGVVGVRNEDENNADGAESAAWKIMGVLERDSDSGSMILSQVTIIAKGANATNWSISLSASSSGLSLQGNGEASHNLVWSATLNYNVITA
jgi:hypothetical protein